MFAVGKDRQEENTARMSTVFWMDMSYYIEQHLLQMFVPVFSYVEAENMNVNKMFVNSQIDQVMPLYNFIDKNEKEAARVEDHMTIEMILLAEANEEHGFNEGNEGFENEISHLEGVENPGETSLEDLFREENEAAILIQEEDNLAEAEIQQDIITQEFIPHEKLAEINTVEFRDFDTFVSNFYTIGTNTLIGSDQLNVDVLESKDMTISRDTEGPQILIFHTHSQEAFADSIEGDTATSIVGIGAYLAQILTEEYGYQVIHHTGEYDKKSRNDAYSLVLPEIEQILADNPSIQIVIDLHRDGFPEEAAKPVTEIDGRPTAKVMFFNGLSRTKHTGNISYLYNQYINDNLAFSYQMQKKAAEYYPGLTRKIYLNGYRYNMHLCPKSLLIELGTQLNTVEEARNACEPLAHILHMVISGE